MTHRKARIMIFSILLHLSFILIIVNHKHIFILGDIIDSLFILPG